MIPKKCEICSSDIESFIQIDGKKVMLGRTRSKCLSCLPYKPLGQCKTCERCGKEFKKTLIINGKKVSTQHRKMCLECSKFKEKRIYQNYLHCPVCEETKTHNEFYWRKDKLNIKKTQECKICHGKLRKKRITNLKQYFVDYAGGKCSMCGYNKCLSALEFHHLDSEEKEFGISQKLSYENKEKILKEMEKCILVCSNCHREIHDEIIQVS